MLNKITYVNVLFLIRVNSTFETDCLVFYFWKISVSLKRKDPTVTDKKKLKLKVAFYEACIFAV